MSLTRREFFLAGATPALAWPQREAVRPNILLILADGLGAWMLGTYGNKEIRTPNIDLLAESGVRFTGHLVCSPAGPPSRVTLFTGRTPQQHGIGDSAAEPAGPESQRQDRLALRHALREVMISDRLSENGYQCAYAGKWAMGDDRNPQHGFRFWYTSVGAESTYQNPQMSWNGKVVREQGYLAELLTRKSIGFLEQQKQDQPFFLVTSYLNPHPPYEGHPQKYYDMYAGTSFETTGWEPPAANARLGKEYLKDIVGNLRRAAAAVTALDDQVGLLLATLRDRKLRDNTLVIFTSDSGYLLGRHGLWSNGFASEPINMYEEVMRTPMIWSWWGKIPVAAARPEVIGSYDFLPSLSEASGVAPPPLKRLCGRSYLPLAMNKRLPKKQPWENLAFGQYRDTAMARDFRYKLILRNNGEGPNELYDLRADAREKVNQYDNAQFSSVRKRLTAELAAWRKKCS